MINRILILWLSLNFTVCRAQNFIPNGDFESITATDSTVINFDNLNSWFAPDYTGGINVNSPHLFSMNSSLYISSAPDNVMTHQYPFSGNNYIGLGLYKSTIDNEVQCESISIKLNESLLNDSIYNISFVVSQGNFSNLKLNVGNIILTEVPIDIFIEESNTYGLTNKKFQILEYSLIATDTLEWVKINLNFRAHISASYLTIGLFSFEQEQTFTSLSNEQFSITSAHYVLDDIECRASDVEIGVNVPNVFTPNNDGINDFFPIDWTNIFPTEVTLINRWGNVVYNSKSHLNGITFSTSDICSGQYYLILSGIDVLNEPFHDYYPVFINN